MPPEEPPAVTEPAPTPTTSSDQSAATPAPAPRTQQLCVVPTLTNTPLSVAQQVLPLLGCKTGKVTHAYSIKVPKGAIIKSSPANSVKAHGTKVNLKVSKGPKRH